MPFKDAHRRMTERYLTGFGSGDPSGRTVGREPLAGAAAGADFDFHPLFVLAGLALGTVAWLRRRRQSDDRNPA